MQNNDLEEDEFFFEGDDSTGTIHRINPPSVRVVIARELVQGDYWLGPRQVSVDKWFYLGSELLQVLNEVVNETIGVLDGDLITITIRRDEAVDTEYAVSSFLFDEVDDSQDDEYLKPLPVTAEV